MRTPLGEDFRADLGAMRAAFTSDTAMVVGSAPTFPHGVVDPIPRSLLHWPGDTAPGCTWTHAWAATSPLFARELGAGIPDFDFAVDGVTSISADLHRYGYTARAPPRSSLPILLRSR